MMKIAVAQIAPVLLNRAATLENVHHAVVRAAESSCQLVVFGESLVPAYPLWLARTDGARFDSSRQKELHAHYLAQAVSIDAGHLNRLSQLAADSKIAVVLGIAERPTDRGGKTLFCSRVFMDANGKLVSVHRKLMPTYEERLVWGMGDGAGLVTHRVGEFTVGALNCWENWMPLARAALYAQGEDLHLMLWPGDRRLTADITRFVARESRSYVVSASGLIRATDIPDEVPWASEMRGEDRVIYDGGSCIAGPDGEWLVEPVVGREELLVAELDPLMVYRERQNFDPAGHSRRPDVLQLNVDRRRQAAATFQDGECSMKREE